MGKSVEKKRTNKGTEVSAEIGLGSAKRGRRHLERHKVLVTGAGLLGVAAIEKFLSAGWDVVGGAVHPRTDRAGERDGGESDEAFSFDDERVAREVGANHRLHCRDLGE